MVTSDGMPSAAPSHPTPTTHPPSTALARHWPALLLALGASVPWSLLALLDTHPAPLAVAVLAGSSILGAAFLLSWGVEAAEGDVPPALAVSVLALVAVLPEYAVDATFAWKAAHDPQHAGFAVANMTGGNRLLLGLGWPLLVLLAWWRHRLPGVQLPTTTRIDVAILLLASLYALVPVLRGQLTLLDTAVFVGLYLAYILAATRASARHDTDDSDEEEEQVGPAALIASWAPPVRKLALLGLLAWSAGAIFLAAEPFAESLIETGRHLHIDEFLLVQWIAPLASEAPELVVAALLVWRAHVARGMLCLVSSKVNQWTLLIGTLPVVTSIAAAQASVLPMDARQREEVLRSYMD